MRMICPQVDAPTTSISRDQGDFLELTAALVVDPGWTVPIGRAYNTVLLAFRPSDEERRRIRAGEDLYIAVLCGSDSIHPLRPHVGREEAAAAFKVGVRL